MLKCATLFTVSGLYCASVSADPSAIDRSIYNLTLKELMQVKTISIATGTDKPVHKAPAVATVITAKEIENLGANSVYDILEQVTGIHIFPSSINRMNPSFSIRGIHTAYNPHTLLLINGIRISYEFTGARWDQLQISTENIDRIEIIRGPGSAVYGSDAYSGVINIITKGVNSASSREIGSKIGSFGTHSLWGNYIQNQGELQYSFNGQYYTTEGDKQRIIEKDRMHSFGPSGIALSNAPGPLDTRRESFDFRTEFKYGGFTGSLWYLKNNAGTGQGIGNALSNGDWEKLQGITLAAGYRWQQTPAWLNAINMSYQDMSRETYFVIFPAGFSTPRQFDENGIPTAFTVFTEGMIGAPFANDEYFNASMTSLYSGIDNHNFRLELGYRKSTERPQEYKNFGAGVLDGSEDFVDATLTDVTNTPHIYSDNRQRELGFLSFQDEWMISPDWEFVLGARFDQYSDFGSTFNPRLALIWDTNQSSTVKFLYGQAFRAPAILELYVTNNPLVKGNEALNPETIGFYEVVFDYHNHADWQLITNLYWYKAKEQIIPSVSSDDVIRFNNLGSQDGYGIEIEVIWQPSEPFEAKFGYTWQHSKSGIDGSYVADAPKQVVDLSFRWTVLDNLSIHINTHWIIDRKRALDDPRQPIDNYNWTNFNLSYRVNESLLTKLIIRNVFDADARAPSTVQLPEDFPLQSRGIWLSLEYQF